jgi:protein MAK16
VINHGHCSFKSKTETQNFCRNPYNVTGLCNRSSCPLANSRYATVVEDKGVCYLMMKTIERAHTPRKLWERVKLSKSYGAALEQLDSHLQFWPKFLVHKTKQRLTKITQYLLRCRKLAKQTRPELITMPAKLEKREARREVKAEVAARLEASIEKELLERLKGGTYDGIYNFPSRQYAKVLSQHAEKDVDGLEEDEEADEDGEEEEDEEGGGIEYVEGYSDLEDEDMEDGDLDFGRFDEEGDDEEEEEDEEEEPAPRAGKRKAGPPAKAAPQRPAKRPPGRRGHVEVEYETEREPRARERA